MSAAHGRSLTFDVHYRGRSERRTVLVGETVIAGWTGRDRARMNAHIAELAELGVAPPLRTPLFYRVASTRLTAAAAIEVCGGESSGEVEFVVVNDAGELFVGVGSDHTDRRVERYDITTAKQMCDKPLAPALWAWPEVQPHWDRLVLRSWIGTGTARELYQEGAVSELLAPADLVVAAREAGAALGPGSVMFCGTLPALGGIRPARDFACELFDPVYERRLTHAYSAYALPPVD